MKDKLSTIYIYKENKAVQIFCWQKYNNVVQYLN